MHLNATLTIQTRRRYTSSLPKNLEELRQKYDVLSNCWLLGQQRQPGRALYSDVDLSTFPRILKELLGKKNFALKKELEGKPLVAPPWGHCLSYEYELRREAYKRCREQSVGFNAAWSCTYADTEHRMLHWLQLVSLANSVLQATQQSISSLVQKEVAAQLKSHDAREAEKVRNSSQHRSSSLFLVPRRHRLHRRLPRRGMERAIGGNRKTMSAKDHQQVKCGPCVTFSKETQRFRTCSTGVKAMASASPVRMDTVRTLPVLDSMCVLVAEATTVTISASACSPRWLPLPELHLRLLLIQILLLPLLRRCPSLL